MSLGNLPTVGSREAEPSGMRSALSSSQARARPENTFHSRGVRPNRAKLPFAPQDPKDSRARVGLPTLLRAHTAATRLQSIGAGHRRQMVGHMPRATSAPTNARLNYHTKLTSAFEIRLLQEKVDTLFTAKRVDPVREDDIGWLMMQGGAKAERAALARRARTQAAIRVQSLVRGHLTRRRLTAEQSRASAAAVRIQSVFRAWQVRKRLRDEAAERDVGARAKSKEPPKSKKKWRHTTALDRPGTSSTKTRISEDVNEVRPLTPEPDQSSKRCLKAPARFTADETAGKLISALAGRAGMVAEVQLALKQTPPLSELHLAHGCLGSAGIGPVAKALWRSGTLQRLELRGNYIGCRGAHKLTAVLSSIPCLQQLGLAWNSIADNGAKCVADMLKHMKALQGLDLSYNRIGEAGADAVAKAIPMVSTLRKLDMRCNQDFCMTQNLLDACGDRVALFFEEGMASINGFTHELEPVGIGESIFGASSPASRLLVGGHDQSAYGRGRKQDKSDETPPPSFRKRNAITAVDGITIGRLRAQLGL